MLLHKPFKNNFPAALKMTRRSRGLSQEAFSLVSSRTYVSSLERGTKVPTLNKIDELAVVMDVHPLTLLTLSYMVDGEYGGAKALMRKISKEILEIYRNDVYLAVSRSKSAR